jgi:hypothetical protein
MTQKFRIWLARKILGQHCACYQMGYHNMVDFEQRCAESKAKKKIN